jgi:hypothetical protein
MRFMADSGVGWSARCCLRPGSKRARDISDQIPSQPAGTRQSSLGSRQRPPKFGGDSQYPSVPVSARQRSPERARAHPAVASTRQYSPATASTQCRGGLRERGQRARRGHIS